MRQCIALQQWNGIGVSVVQSKSIDHLELLQSLFFRQPRIDGPPVRRQILQARVARFRAIHGSHLDSADPARDGSIALVASQTDGCSHRIWVFLPALRAYQTLGAQRPVRCVSGRNAVVTVLALAHNMVVAEEHLVHRRARTSLADQGETPGVHALFQIGLFEVIRAAPVARNRVFATQTESFAGVRCIIPGPDGARAAEESLAVLNIFFASVALIVLPTLMALRFFVAAFGADARVVPCFVRATMANILAAHGAFDKIAVYRFLAAAVTPLTPTTTHFFFDGDNAFILFFDSEKTKTLSPYSINELGEGVLFWVFPFLE